MLHTGCGELPHRCAGNHQREASGCRQRTLPGLSTGLYNADAQKLWRTRDWNGGAACEATSCLAKPSPFRKWPSIRPASCRCIPQSRQARTRHGVGEHGRAGCHAYRRAPLRKHRGISACVHGNPLPQGVLSPRESGEPSSRSGTKTAGSACAMRLFQRETDHATPEIFLDRIG